MDNINIVVGIKTFTLDYTAGKTSAMTGYPLADYVIDGKKVTERTWFTEKAKAEIAEEAA